MTATRTTIVFLLLSIRIIFDLANQGSEVPRESELIRRRRAKGNHYRTRSVRGSERYGPGGYLRVIAIREVPEAFIKSHQTLRRKLSDRDVNHSREAIRTNPCLARVRWQLPR